MNNDMNNPRETDISYRQEQGGEAAAPVKKRRVGTITMALSLIATGTLIILGIILPGLDVLSIIRFAPLVLVFLGIEILFAAFRYKDVKIKYDGLSIFICIILIIGSTAASIIPEAIRLYTNREYVESRLRAELEQRSYDVLAKDKNEIHNLRWSVYNSSFNYDENMTVEDIGPENQPQAQVYFKGGFSSPEQFAAKCHAVLQELKTVCPSIRYASFYSAPSRYSFNGDNYYSVWLDGVFQINWDEKTIAENVSAEFWVDDMGQYEDKETYDSYLEDRSGDEIEQTADNNENDDIINMPDYLHISYEEHTSKGYSWEFELLSGMDYGIDLEQYAGIISISISDSKSGREVTAFDWANQTSEMLNFYLDIGRYTMYVELEDFAGSFTMSKSS